MNFFFDFFFGGGEVKEYQIFLQILFIVPSPQTKILVADWRR